MDGQKNGQTEKWTDRKMDGQELNERLWQEILSRAGKTFETHKGASFTYQIKKDRYGETSGDLVINGKGKTITRSTVLLACHRAMEVQNDHGCVSRPGKIGVYGDTWLYPVFLDIGICTKTTREKARQFDQETACNSEPHFPDPQDSVKPGPVKTCSNCGYTTAEDFEYCPKCGRKL